MVNVRLPKALRLFPLAPLIVFAQFTGCKPRDFNAAKAKSTRTPCMRFRDGKQTPLRKLAQCLESELRFESHDEGKNALGALIEPGIGDGNGGRAQIYKKLHNNEPRIILFYSSRLLDGDTFAHDMANLSHAAQGMDIEIQAHVDHSRLTNYMKSAPPDSGWFMIGPDQVGAYRSDVIVELRAVAKTGFTYMSTNASTGEYVEIYRTQDLLDQEKADWDERLRRSEVNRQIQEERALIAQRQAGQASRPSPSMPAAPEPSAPPIAEGRPAPQIPDELQKYQLDKLLSRGGSFGATYTLRGGEIPLVAKFLQPVVLSEKQVSNAIESHRKFTSALKACKEECTWAFQSPPEIVPYKDKAFQDRVAAVFIQPRALGNIREMVSKYRSNPTGKCPIALDQAAREQYFRDTYLLLGRGIYHVAKHGMAHSNVKWSNILVNSDGSVVLSDYDKATPRLEYKAFPGVYTAPEATKGKGDHLSDLYSLSATLVELSTGTSLIDLFVQAVGGDASPLQARETLYASPQAFSRFSALVESKLAEAGFTAGSSSSQGPSLAKLLFAGLSYDPGQRMASLGAIEGSKITFYLSPQNASHRLIHSKCHKLL